ncbi:hypothetical protein MG293_016693 [Ovis ammon polii]|uniref:Uncharacterized protein n=1 Tax=Ovis ammon polii TaxID=230172 RepID=A0AAD4TWS4_OVIAM|nr:hypothetical protein MG293_016693 [Ovis ammon polii]
MLREEIRAPGAQLGVSSCLGKCQKSSPDARRQPFSGKSFYLDLPAGKNLQFLTGAIQQLGGDESDPLSVIKGLQVIEGFLSKEVSYIVSSRREAKAESSRTSHRGCPSPSEVTVDTPPVANPKGSRARPAQKAMDPVPLSRGKELLQKAIRNQGSSSGGGSGHSSSLLSNARSWGVQILHVDGNMSSRVKNTEREAKDQEPSRRSAACTVPRRRKGYCECCQEAFEELHRQPQAHLFSLPVDPPPLNPPCLPVFSATCCQTTLGHPDPVCPLLGPDLALDNSQNALQGTASIFSMNPVDFKPRRPEFNPGPATL